MAQGTAKESGFEPFPTADYPMVFDSIEETDSSFGGTQLKAKLTFDLEGEEYQDRWLCAWCRPYVAPTSKLNKWFIAAGRPIEIGEAWDSDWLIGRPVTCTVLLLTKDDNGAEYNKIAEIKPRKGAKSSAQRPAPVAHDPEDPFSDEPPAEEADEVDILPISEDPTDAAKREKYVKALCANIQMIGFANETAMREFIRCNGGTSITTENPSLALKRWMITGPLGEVSTVTRASVARVNAMKEAGNAE